MATDKPRYTVSLDDELFEQLEDFRYEHRYPTRSSATAALIHYALKVMKEEKEGKEQKDGGMVRKGEEV